MVEYREIDKQFWLVWWILKALRWILKLTGKIEVTRPGNLDAAISVVQGAPCGGVYSTRFNPSRTRIRCPYANLCQYGTDQWSDQCPSGNLWNRASVHKNSILRSVPGVQIVKAVVLDDGISYAVSVWDQFRVWERFVLGTLIWFAWILSI